MGLSAARIGIPAAALLLALLATLCSAATASEAIPINGGSADRAPLIEIGLVHAATVNPVGQGNVLLAQSHSGVIPIITYLQNTSLAEGGTPLTITATLPVGLTLAGVESGQNSREIGVRFTCAQVDQTVTCTMGLRNNPAVAAGLASQMATFLYLIVRASPTLVASGTADASLSRRLHETIAALSDITVSVSAETVAGPLTAIATAKAFATNQAVPAELMVEGIEPQTAERTSRFFLRVRNIGGLPATSGDGHPAITINEIMPFHREAIDHSATGSGWRCLDEGTRSLDCTRRSPLGIGQAADEVVVAWKPLPILAPGQRAPDKWIAKAVAHWSDPATRRSGLTRGEHHMLMAIETLVPAHLVARARTPRGIVLPQLARTVFTVQVHNTGEVAAARTGVDVTLPAGVLIADVGAGWTCTATGTPRTCRLTAGTLAPGATKELRITLTTTRDAPTGHRQVRFRPFADNDRKSRAHSIPLLVHDLGDPEATPTLQFNPSGRAWRDWRSGAVTTVHVDQSISYRVTIRNRGGNVVPAGSSVRITQGIGRGVTALNAVASGGGTCTLRPLSCTITAGRTIAVGQAIGTVTITVAPHAVARRVNVGPIITSVEGEAGNEQVPVLLRAIPTDRTLRVSTHIKRIPDVDGLGEVTLRVFNLQRGSAAQGLSVQAPLPAGVHIDKAVGQLWTCRQVATIATCTFGADLPARTKSPLLTLTLRATRAAAPTMTPSTQLWRATAKSAGSGSYAFGIAKVRLAVRKAIRVAATSAPRVIAASKNPRALRSVILRGDGSVGNGVSLDYSWTQRCTTAADVAAFGRCPGKKPVRTVRIDSPHASIARARIPSVATRTTFVFQLTITDGSSTLEKTVRATATPAVRLVQRDSRPVSSKGGSSRQALAAQRAAQRGADQQHQRSATQAAAALRSTQRAGASGARAIVNGAARVTIGGSTLIDATPGQDVALTVRVLKGTAQAVEWTQVGGSPVAIRDRTSAAASIRTPDVSGPLAFKAVITNPTGQQSTAQVTIHVGAAEVSQAASPDLCSVVAASSTGKPVGLGNAISVTFGKIAANATTASSCGVRLNRPAQASTGTGGSFSKTAISIGGLTITGAAGSYSAAGLELTSGTLTMPSSWQIAPLSIGSKPLSLVFGTAKADAQLSGSLTSPGFAFITLPSGWSGSTTLTFAPGDSGAMTGTITAKALNGNGGTADFTGTLQAGGTFSVDVTANELITIGETPLDLSGSISNATGTVVSSITGSIAAPIDLAPGVSLSTLTATWGVTGTAADAPVVTGQAVVAIQSGSETPTALTASLSYTSTTDWSIDVSSSGGPTWTPLAGLNVTPSDFSGSIAKVKGQWQWGLVASIPTWTPTAALTLTNLKIELSNTCSSTTLVCPKSEMFMQVSANAAVDPPGGSVINVTADAIFGIGGGDGFSLYASVPGSINVAQGLSITTPSLTASYGLPDDAVTPTTGAVTFEGATEGGWSVTAAGGLTVPGLGSFTDIAVNITSLGVSLGGFDADGVSLGGGSNGSQSGTAFGWSSIATTMTADIPSFGEQILQLKPGLISVQGGYDAPAWWDSLTQDTMPLALGTIQFNPANGFFDAEIEFEGVHSIPAGGSTMSVPTLFFDIRFNAQGLTVSAGGVTDLSITALGGSSQTAPTLTFEISYDITENALSGTFQFQDATGWNDAFGVNGLVIDDLAISLGITLDPPIPLPSIGLYASGVLPESLTRAFGVSNGVPISMTAELSETSPCLAISVGSSTGNTPIMSVGSGAVTATYFEFAVAPDGCTVGTSQVPAGMSLEFDGAVFGTTVDVSASLQLDPVIFTAKLKIGAFTIPGTGGSVSFQQTVIDVSINEQTQVDEVDFSGGFTMLGTTISVSGSLTKTATSVKASLTVAQTQPLDVAGFTLSNLSITLKVEYGAGVENLSVAASGDMNVMGTTLAVGFAATIDNGVIENVDVNATLSGLQVGSVSMSGSFQGSYTESTGAFDVNAAVTVTVGGFSFDATLAISPQCIAFTGSVTVGSVFSAQLEGAIIYKADCTSTVVNAAGSAVTGAPGDFSFAASNVTLNLAGFDVTGNVGFGSVGGDFYALVGAEIDLSPQGSGDMVAISGEFQSNGDFAFSGSGTLALAGFSLAMQVTASSESGNVSVAGSTTLNLYGSTLYLAGSFTMDGGQVSTTLNATVDLSIGGWNLANAAVTLSDTPTSIGLTADVAIDVDVAQLSGRLTFIENGSNTPLFYLAAQGTITIPGIGGIAMDGTFTNCTDPTCSQAAGDTTLTMTGSIDLGGDTFDFPTVSISSDGQFSVSAAYSGNPCSGEIYLLVVRGWGCAWYNETLLITNSDFSVSSDQGITIYFEAWWPFSWHGPWSFGFGGGFSLQTDPFQACLSVDVWHGHGFSICIP